MSIGCSQNDQATRTLVQSLETEEEQENDKFTANINREEKY